MRGVPCKAGLVIAVVVGQEAVLVAHARASAGSAGASSAREQHAVTIHHRAGIYL